MLLSFYNTDKVIDGYELDRVETLPLTIDYNVENNVINVYYKKADYDYKVLSKILAK